MAPTSKPKADEPAPRVQVFSVVQLLIIAGVSAVVTLVCSVVLPSRGATTDAPSSGALRHGQKLWAGGGGPDENVALSQLLGRTFRTGNGSKCDPNSRPNNHNFMKGLAHRGLIGPLLQEMGLAGDGVEIGVNRGLYSKEILASWKAGRKYFLVDPWLHQADYVDMANVNQDEFDKVMAEAMENVKPWVDRVVVKRKFSYDAVKEFEDCSLDFIYIDAVHDYDGALADIVDWWPKLAYGGLYAGHDYNDFTWGDGPQRTIFGVKSAADHFAVLANRQLWHTSEPAFAGHTFDTFYMVK